MKKKILLSMFLGVALGMMLVGCGYKDSDSKMESEEKLTETSDTTQGTKEDDKAAETPESTESPVPAEAGEEDDGSQETKAEGKYETYVDKKIKIDGSQERVQILRNEEMATDVKMTVGEAEVSLERVSMEYAQARVKVQDCTGDGKDDIVLVLHGGASGANDEIQILTREQGNWKEVPFPEELWEEDFISFKKAGKKMKIAVPGTKEEKVVDDASDDEWGTRYRPCKVGKDGQVTIVYPVYRGDDINNIVGKIKLTMRYDQATKAFKIAKTTFAF